MDDHGVLQGSQKECEMMSENEVVVEERFLRAQVCHVDGDHEDRGEDLDVHANHVARHVHDQEGRGEGVQERDHVFREPRDPRTLPGKDQSRRQDLYLQRRERRPGCSGDWRQSPRSCWLGSCF